MKKNRLFAPFLMLLAGAVASLMMYRFHYSMKEMLPILLAVLLLFYVAGCFIQVKVNAFVSQIREAEEQERIALEQEAARQEEASADQVEETTEDEAE